MAHKPLRTTEEPYVTRPRYYDERTNSLAYDHGLESWARTEPATYDKSLTVWQRRRNSSSVSRPAQSLDPVMPPETEAIWKEPFLSNGAQAIIRPSSKQDTSIHLQFDIAEDLEGHLEEFSRLKRLGSYRSAERYFQENLKDFIDVPIVSVELADMLLNQGAYKRLKGLQEQNVLNSPLSVRAQQTSREKPRQSDVPNSANDSSSDSDSASNILKKSAEPSSASAELNDAFEKYNITFHLIEAVSDMLSRGRFKEAVMRGEYKERKIPSRKLTTAPSSNDLHMTLLSLQIIKFVGRRSKFADGHDDHNDDYPKLYAHLLEQSRIWEARDLIITYMRDWDARYVWLEVTGTDISSEEWFTTISRQWKAKQYDPSTYLALLDVLVALHRQLMLGFLPQLNPIATTKRCLEQARDLALQIRENDPEYIKSRPYIQWIVAQEEFSRKLGYEEAHLKSPSFGRNFQHLMMFPGVTFWINSLPLYVPADMENPGPHISDFPESDNELLQSALEASEELEDYPTQVLCLRELICRAKVPWKLFDKLTYLQKSIQGDIAGYLQTCISKYLYATTVESRQALIDELIRFDGENAMSYNVADPLILWCERKIQSALYLSMGLIREAGNAQREARRHEIQLPHEIGRAVSKGNFHATNGVYESESVNQQSRPSEIKETIVTTRRVPEKEINESRERRPPRGVHIHYADSDDSEDRKLGDASTYILRPVDGSHPKRRPKDIERRKRSESRREYATTGKELVNVPHRRPDYVEEIHRDFPLYSHGIGQHRDTDVDPISNNNPEEVEMTYKIKFSPNDMAKEPLPERHREETSDQYKHRMREYISNQERIRERSSMAIFHARSRIDRLNDDQEETGGSGNKPDKISRDETNETVPQKDKERQEKPGEVDETQENVSIHAERSSPPIDFTTDVIPEWNHILSDNGEGGSSSEEEEVTGERIRDPSPSSTHSYERVSGRGRSPRPPPPRPSSRERSHSRGRSLSPEVKEMLALREVLSR